MEALGYESSGFDHGNLIGLHFLSAGFLVQTNVQ
jgi:hypothetical protein